MDTICPVWRAAHAQATSQPRWLVTVAFGALPAVGPGCWPRGVPVMTTWILGGFQTDFARAYAKEGLDISDLIAETTRGTL